MLTRSHNLKVAAGLAVFALTIAPVLAQDQDRDRDWDAQQGKYTRISPGTVVPIRMNQTIDVDRSDNRVYYGTVDQEVRGENGRIAIPRGAKAELIVRVAPDNDLILDLESIVVNGDRYAIRSEPNRIESQRDNSLVGAIVGAIDGGQARGRTVRVQRDSVVTFRMDRPLEIGVTDRGTDRNGVHYHGGSDHQ
jgi:hypothetical protein